MSRPRRPRSIGGEANLAERVRREMAARHWSYAQLSIAMKAAGCDINPSSLQKSLVPSTNAKGEPHRRAITVDEMIALSAVFDVPLTNLLTGVDLLDQDEVRGALDDMDRADELLVRAVQLMLDAEVTLYRTLRFGSPEVRQIIADGNQYWWKSDSPNRIVPKQAGPESVALSSEALQDQINGVKALVATIAMTWIGAEDDRERGRTTPGPTIGSQAWADLMERYLRTVHSTQPPEYNATTEAALDEARAVATGEGDAPSFDSFRDYRDALGV